ncbi:TIGR03899 family protein [Shewanella sp. OMA3-2]|uniref:TIGR03899 family protein n=1 Tax=Shewanella sp. OMA3-2 TaxID=2908650 RepID=UPI001F45326F|nr:TIGR03899 family protein [Shewanella sp. OMA3-2]UJF21636.1 TIGR03899 family protein [Shewanella sp. OMA3-2]
MSEPDNNPTEVDIQATDTVNMSARKKALLLGRILGLASEDDYRPSSASIAERAQHRQRKQLSAYQANLENIFSLALNYTPSDVTGVDLDADWSHQFFQMAEQIHNRKMQDLWARILASEIVSPGNFSLRSLSVLKQFTFREALIIEKALGMSVKIGADTRYKLLSGYRINGGVKQYFRKNNQVNIPLSQYGLPYSNILTLIDTGVLHNSEFETGLLDPKVTLPMQFVHDNFNLQPMSQHLLFTYYRFTTTGDEICQLIAAKQDNGFTQMLKGILQQDFNIS